MEESSRSAADAAEAVSVDDEPLGYLVLAMTAGDSLILLGPEVGAWIIDWSRTKVGKEPDFG